MNTKIIKLEETDSTNTYLKNYSPSDDEEMVVAVADYQTAGRGQGTHAWESERGKNLLFSILVRPVWVPVTRQFLLSMAGAIALKDVLDTYTEGITLKWPNDVYWYDKKDKWNADRDFGMFAGHQAMRLWHRTQCEPRRVCK